MRTRKRFFIIAVILIIAIGISIYIGLPYKLRSDFLLIVEKNLRSFVD